MHRRTHSKNSSTSDHPTSSLIQAAQALSSIGAPGPTRGSFSGSSGGGGYDNVGGSLNPDGSSYSKNSSSYQQGYDRNRLPHQSSNSYPPEYQAQSSHSASTTLVGSSNPSPQPYGHNSQQSLSYSNSSSRRPDIPNSHTAPGGLQLSSDSRRMNSQSQRAGGGVGLNVHTDTVSREQKYTPNPVDRKYVALTPTSSSSAYGHGTSHSQSGHFGLSDAWSGSDRLGSDRTTDRPLPTGYVGNGKYLANWCIYAMDWCKWPIQNPGYGKDGYGKVAIASYCEDSHNYIQVLNAHAPTQRPGEAAQQVVEYTKIAETSHIYPITRILWEPPSAGNKTSTDLMATSGDHLRLWSLPNSSSGPANTSNTITRSNTYSGTPAQKLTPLALLSNSKSNDSSAPLTSLDWNPISSNLIITSSIDTTCTIWDIPSLTAKTQLIAHDKEVFDVRFMSGSVDVFASCGADGSVRMFDLRSLEHSTIIYEPTVAKPSGDSKDGGSSPTQSNSSLHSPPPLLRLAASPHDQHLLATITADSNVIRILDVRQPGTALMELKGATGAINCLEWAPSRRGILAAGSDDSLALVWDLYSGPDAGKSPIMGWRSDYEVNSLSWSPAGQNGSEWLGVAGGRGINGVRAI